MQLRSGKIILKVVLVLIVFALRSIVITDFCYCRTTSHPSFSALYHDLDTIKSKDTCIIEGMHFEIVDNGEIKGLKAIIRNGRIKIISSNGGKKDFRVIRYVFSIRSDENYSSVRHYGDLISYLVVNLLKEGEKDDLFYFEDIIIVDQSKTILNDAVKPIIIKKL